MLIAHIGLLVLSRLIYNKDASYLRMSPFRQKILQPWSLSFSPWLGLGKIRYLLVEARVSRCWGTWGLCGDLKQESNKYQLTICHIWKKEVNILARMCFIYFYLYLLKFFFFLTTIFNILIITINNYDDNIKGFNCKNVLKYSILLLLILKFLILTTTQGKSVNVSGS